MSNLANPAEIPENDDVSLVPIRFEVSTIALPNLLKATTRVSPTSLVRSGRVFVVKALKDLSTTLVLATIAPNAAAALPPTTLERELILFSVLLAFSPTFSSPFSAF